MARQTTLQLLQAFLKEHIHFLLFASLPPLIYTIIFYLLNYESAALFYILILIFFLELLYLSYLFYRYQASYHALLTAHNALLVAPFTIKPRTVSDQILIKSICDLQNTYNKMMLDKEMQFQEMMDYYTLWIHQIKTPMAALKLLLQSEENTTNTIALAELFKIEQYAQMALQYVRMEADSNDFVLESLSIDALIKQALRKYSSLFILQKISLHYEPINMKIVSDEKWLIFVLEQLLSNALKYTRQGSITIYSPAPYQLCIQDSGMGIRSEDLPRIFEKGFTGFNGRSDKRASGIGLYLSKRILDKLNHTITISSKLEEGTTVTLDFMQYQGNFLD